MHVNYIGIDVASYRTSGLKLEVSIMKNVTLSAPLLARLHSSPSRTRSARLGIERCVLPVGKRCLAPHPQGRIDVHIAVLDCVDEAPEIKGDTCIEAYVDVGFGDVASKDECSAGPLRGCVAVAQSIGQYAQQISRRQKAGEQKRAWCAPT